MSAPSPPKIVIAPVTAADRHHRGESQTPHPYDAYPLASVA
jgi:hypothetical protein